MSSQEPTRVVKTSLSGYDLLSDPSLNKGTAFSEEERDEFDLHGLLPPTVGTLDDQVARRLKALRAFSTDLERYAFLRDLQDINTTIFFSLLGQNIEELLPIVYTPTVGEGCQQFSHLFRKARGLFLSLPLKNRIRQILRNPVFDPIEVVVVTDGERILGLGDQGAGGMGIAIGKLALYTAAGGIAPATALPIMLDVGTDNAERLVDPLYIGWRHERVRGAEYDEFVEEFVSAVEERWPHVLLQWEDFAKANATRLLNRYRNRLCTFNDDIQGTAAIATGALLAAVNVSGVPLARQRIAVVGAGSAGCGIASLVLQAMTGEGIDEREARRQFFMIDRDGLLVEGMNSIEPFQRPFAQPKAAVDGWALDETGRISLLDVIRNAKPSTLIGVSGQTGAFSETAVRAMAAHNERPIIFPLSNPTSRSEAIPADIEAWTGGRAIVSTGSPFPPLVRAGAKFAVDQTNNSYVFPGIGLGAIAVKARRITDAMFMAAARAVAELSPARLDPRKNLLPPIGSLREVAAHVAIAVAKQACKEGVAGEASAERIEEMVRAKIWLPGYARYRRIR